MSTSKPPTRRSILGAAAALSAMSLAPLDARGTPRRRRDPGATIANLRARLAMASYSLRKFDLEQTLAMTARLGLGAISLKSFHLPLDAAPEAIAACVEKAKRAGIVIYAGGVISMKDEREVDGAFAYARAAGMLRIVASPLPEMLPRIEEKVREYDLEVCIHNHGPGDAHWATPEIAYPKIEPFDRRIGLCHDVGHTQRTGADPIAQTAKYADRIHDLHLKDVSESQKSGYTVPCGRGVIDLPALLSLLVEIEYAGHLAFEYERNADDPLPEMGESVGYVRGVLDELATRSR